MSPHCSTTSSSALPPVQSRPLDPRAVEPSFEQPLAPEPQTDLPASDIKPGTLLYAVGAWADEELPDCGVHEGGPVEQCGGGDSECNGAGVVGIWGLIRVERYELIVDDLWGLVETK